MTISETIIKKSKKDNNKLKHVPNFYFDLSYIICEKTCILCYDVIKIAILNRKIFFIMIEKKLYKSLNYVHLHLPATVIRKPGDNQGKSFLNSYKKDLFRHYTDITNETSISLKKIQLNALSVLVTH